MLEITKGIEKLTAPKSYAVFKMNRLIVVLNNPDCELCSSPAKHVHHKDENRSNNELSNLQALCVKCHRKIHRKYKEKIRQKAKECGLTYSGFTARMRKGIPLFVPKNSWHKKLLYELFP